ncbi:MAG: type II toxin-antitoxin system RelE/ParE family toxin [Acidimicrobiales bacterium]
MRIRFADDRLRKLYEDPLARDPRLGRDLIKSFRKKMQFLASATNEQDIRAMKSLRLEKLGGDRDGQHSIRLNDQWRLILVFEHDPDGRLVIVVEIVDYH